MSLRFQAKHRSLIQIRVGKCSITLQVELALVGEISTVYKLLIRQIESTQKDNGWRMQIRS